MTRYWVHNESDCVFESEDDDDSPYDHDCWECERGDYLRYVFDNKWPSAPMRVIVCGGRDYNDRARAFYVLDELRREYTCELIIVNGGARGADLLAREWASEELGNGVRLETHPADWDKHGRAAGPIRNKVMLDSGVELVIAFPGGRGTANMCEIAARAGVMVRKIDHA